jgi:hypothetical protein
MKCHYWADFMRKTIIENSSLKEFQSNFIIKDSIFFFSFTFLEPLEVSNPLISLGRIVAKIKVTDEVSNK